MVVNVSLKAAIGMAGVLLLGLAVLNTRIEWSVMDIALSSYKHNSPVYEHALDRQPRSEFQVTRNNIEDNSAQKENELEKKLPESSELDQSLPNNLPASNEPVIIQKMTPLPTKQPSDTLVQDVQTSQPRDTTAAGKGKYSTPRPNTIAIVSYVGSKLKYAKQTRHMLWSSWNHTTKTAPLVTRSRVDLLLFGDDNLLQNIPPGCTLVDINEPNLVAKIQFSNVDRCYIFNHTYSPTDYWHKNKFMFSLVFIADPAYRELFTSYSDFLRTDTDVAITPQFMKFKPDQFVVGRGGYMIYDFTKQRMAQIASELNMTYQKIHNVGSTWFGNATLTVIMVDRLIEVARWILEHPVYGVELGWTKWHVGVLSMYSAELVINDFIPNKKLWLNHLTMDINAISEKRTDYVHHIHCWPDKYNGLYFDKLAFEAGNYTREAYPREKLDTMLVKDYMMAMAVYGY